jgi:hypothetical protein
MPFPSHAFGPEGIPPASPLLLAGDRVNSPHSRGSDAHVTAHPLLPVPTYLAGIIETVAATAELGGCSTDGGEGHRLLSQKGG